MRALSAASAWFCSVIVGWATGAISCAILSSRACQGRAGKGHDDAPFQLRRPLPLFHGLIPPHVAAPHAADPPRGFRDVRFVRDKDDGDAEILVQSLKDPHPLH